MSRLVFTLFALAALSFFATSSQAVEIIIDDGPSGSPNTTEITWAPSSGAPDWNYRPESGTSNKPNSYNGTGSRFAFGTSPIETATYTPNIPTTGQYNVAMWWPTFDWSNDVPITVTHQGGTSSLSINQSTDSGKWVQIGVYTFDAGTSGSVTISSDVGDLGASNVGPVADAMRFWTHTPLIAAQAAYASSTNTTNPDRPVDNVINLSGMSDQDTIFGYDTHADTTWGDDVNWMADSGDLAGWVAVDLGDLYDLNRMEVFNFNSDNGVNNRGVGVGDIYISSEENPGMGTASFLGTSWDPAFEDFSFTEASGGDNYNTPDILDLTGLSGRWIALDIDSNLGGTFTGLGEILVYGNTLEAEAVIPEPTTVLIWSLLAGLGVGLGWRRRK
jgi:hypothetical protein